ncbi:RluA family pseudouridine synthase [Sporosarcina sp. CAU 1771]
MIEYKHSNSQFILTFRFTGESQLLREFLAGKDISKRTLTAIKYDGGKIYVNEIERTVRHHLIDGDIITVILPPENVSEGLVPEEGKLEIIYEDDAILIINKPPGQSTIPSRDHLSGTVANLLAGKFQQEQIPTTVHIVTRLDFDTSGLLCIAKNRHIHHLFGEQMKDSVFHRQYEAIVEGHVEEEKFSIEAPIGRKEGSIIERTVREDGQFALTDVQVLERFEKNGKKLTRVAIRLRTGRTHQIRVHMSSLGHPLVGDDLYGGSRFLLDRQALHCTQLKFNHPLTRESKEFKCIAPIEMRELYEKS